MSSPHRAAESQDPGPDLQLEEGGHQYQISHAQKLEAIGQLAAGIAHEINTPTQYVGDNVRFLDDSFRDILALARALIEIADTAAAQGVSVEQVAAARDHIEDIDFEFLAQEVPKAISQTLEGIEQISRIVRAMKEFSHPDQTERTLLQINNAIESTITVARNEWKYVAKIERDLDPGLPMISCFAGDLNQVFLNILVNAVHAIEEANGDTGEVGLIKISTRMVGDSVEIRVSDSGAGVPEHARHRLFDPFFTTKPVGKGTGQGLALCYSIVVEKHGGSISFESETGKGTTFIIRIPAVASGTAGGDE